MNNHNKLFTQSLLPALLCAALTLPVIGLSSSVAAADKPVSASAQAEQRSELVNINQANAEALAQVLKGIGLKKAEAIVAWRSKHGKFTQASQLLEIKGIGEKTLEKNRSLIAL